MVLANEIYNCQELEGILVSLAMDISIERLDLCERILSEQISCIWRYQIKPETRPESFSDAVDCSLV